MTQDGSDQARLDELSPQPHCETQVDLDVPPFKVTPQPKFKFVPQPDITPYELAVVVEELCLTCNEETIDSLIAKTRTDNPFSRMRRHFVEVKR